MENKKKVGWHWNYLASIFMTAVCAIIFIETFNIKEADSVYFPRILCGVTVLLSVLLAIQTARGGEKEEVSFAGTKKAAGMLVILVAYVVLNMLTGFYISTLVYLPIAMLYLGQRNWKIIVPISILLPLATFGLFEKLLGMQMPVGMLMK